MIAEQLIRCPAVHVGDFPACDESELDEIVAVLEENCSLQTDRSLQRGILCADGRLDMCKQSIGPAGGRRVAEALRMNKSVNSLLLGTNGLGDDGISAVAEVAANAEQLHTLYLGCNGIRVKGVKALCEAITSNSNIRNLWLKRNPVADDGIAAICQMLETTDNLEVLDLQNSGMTDVGFEMLVDSLCRNTSVRCLYLGANGIQSGAGEHLARLIREPASLQHLFLDTNNIGDEGVAEIAHALHERPLVRLGLASNGIGDTGITALLEARGIRSLGLGYARSTKILGCKGNQFGEAGLEAFMSHLPDSGLEELILDWRSFEKLDITPLLKSVQDCQTLSHFSISPKSLPWWTAKRLRDTIQEVSKRNLPPVPEAHRSNIKSNYR